MATSKYCMVCIKMGRPECTPANEMEVLMEPESLSCAEFGKRMECDLYHFHLGVPMPVIKRLWQNYRYTYTSHQMYAAMEQLDKKYANL